MSILNVDIVRLLQSVEAFADAVIPLHRMVPRIGRRLSRRWNVGFLAVFVVLICGTAGWSAFPPATFEVLNGRIVGPAGGVSWLVLRCRLVLCSCFATAIIAAFLVDLKDAVHARPFNRFVFSGKTKNEHEQVWWSIAVLFVGYLTRVLLFGLVAAIGLATANTASVVASGMSIFAAGGLPTGYGSLADLIRLVLANPFGFRETVASGSVWAEVFVIYLAVVRLAVVFFLIGTFYVLIPALRTLYAPAVQREQPSDKDEMPNPPGS